MFNATFKPKESKICTFMGKDYYCMEYTLSNNELVKIYFEKFNDKKITVKYSLLTKVSLTNFLSKAMDNIHYCNTNGEYLKREINSIGRKYQLSSIYQNKIARNGKTKNASFKFYFDFKGGKQ